jgi:hypothetical protein
LILAAKDHTVCMFLGLVVWLEHFLHSHPNAIYMMSPGQPEGKSKKQHKKFTQAISKTYKNRLDSIVFKDKGFQAIYQGSDKRPLGLHSKRKMGSTQAKRRGAGGDQVDHRGRWVAKKGSRIVNGVYIDPEDVFADAFVASKLAFGGPIKYKLKAEVAAHITKEWLATNVIPSVGAGFHGDASVVTNLGLAMLWLAMDEEAFEDLNVAETVRVRVKTAYAELPLDNKPEQPVLRVSLHVYRHEEETIIEEVMAMGQQQQQQQLQQQQLQQQQPDSVAHALAMIPAAAGAGTMATQHFLQTLVIQQRNTQRQIEELQQLLLNSDESNRI